MPNINSIPIDWDLLLKSFELSDILEMCNMDEAEALERLSPYLDIPDHFEVYAQRLSFKGPKHSDEATEEPD